MNITDKPTQATALPPLRCWTCADAVQDRKALHVLIYGDSKRYRCPDCGATHWKLGNEPK